MLENDFISKIAFQGIPPFIKGVGGFELHNLALRKNEWVNLKILPFISFSWHI